jgi:uncharacterized protein YndB with AHSA1/START domain
VEAHAGARTEAAPAIEREVRIDAAPETVFEFFTDPEKMVRWKGQTAELDPRPGGTYRVKINEQAIARGEYVEVDPPRRVVFTWGWEGGQNPVEPGTSTVEITLEPDDDGGTRVRLVHRDLPTTEEAEKHTHGWDHYMERLATAAAGGDPGPDSFADPADHSASG